MQKNRLGNKMFFNFVFIKDEVFSWKLWLLLDIPIIFSISEIQNENNKTRTA